MHGERPRIKTLHVRLHGAGLRSSELGKVAEFVVELNGAKPTDITIAIECKPLRGAVHDDKPDLSEKPVNKNTYSVKCLPTRPGDYVISILHCGAYILRNPFYLTLPAPNGEHTPKTPSSFTHKTLCTFLCRHCTTYKVKVPNFEFCRGQEHETTTFLFFS